MLMMMTSESESQPPCFGSSPADPWIVMISCENAQRFAAVLRSYPLSARSHHSANSAGLHWYLVNSQMTLDKRQAQSLENLLLQAASGGDRVAV
jgi:hypothetical protein